MTAENIYQACPIYETASFCLRLVRLEDAPALLKCYSDRKVVARLNADSCTNDFYYTTLEEMTACIRFWLMEYENEQYVRFAILPKAGGGPVGTMEIFGGETGVLRIDLAADYDRESTLRELLELAVRQLMGDFQAESLKIKASNTPDRIPLLESFGFVPSKTFRPELGYYER